MWLPSGVGFDKIGYNFDGIGQELPQLLTKSRSSRASELRHLFFPWVTVKEASLLQPRPKANASTWLCIFSSSLALIYHQILSLYCTVSISSLTCLLVLQSPAITTPFLFPTPQKTFWKPSLTCYLFVLASHSTSTHFSQAFITPFSHPHIDKRQFLLRLPV